MAIAAVLSIIITISGGGSGVFMLALGSCCCLGGVLSLLLAAVYNISGKKEWGRAFLLSAGITFLVGTGVCSTYLL